MRKVMKLIDLRTGEMQCRVCGSVHYASLASGGRFKRGSWKCRFYCSADEIVKENKS